MINRLIHTVKVIPLLAFMITARSGGMTELAWKNAFIVGGLCTILVIALQLYKKIILDRLMLGVNLFLLIGACAFFGNLWSILYYFGAYKGPVFLSCIFLVGLLTTLFSSAGFIGVISADQKKIRKSSLQLLFLSIMCIIWAVMTNDSGFIVSVVIPFIILRIAREKLSR